MAKKKVAFTGIAELIVIAVAGYAFYKATQNKDTVQTKAGTSSSIPRKVIYEGFVFRPPQNWNTYQQEQWVEAQKTYTDKYVQYSVEHPGVTNPLDTPGTAGAQERALIDSAREKSMKGMLSQQPYIEGFDYKAVFGFDYPGDA